MRPARPVVLVVEDDATIVALLQELLDQEGYVVEIATDGAAGLARIEAGGIDLVLLDLGLPLLDGLELCRRVRAQARGPYLPIIMLTAYVDQRHAGFQAGADDFISKPFQVEDLLARVHVWLGTRERLCAAHALEQRLAAERAEAARLAGALLAARTLEHELNNKLTIVAGYAQVLAGSADIPTPLQSAARSVARTAQEAAALVQRLQQLTHIEETPWGSLGATIDLSSTPGEAHG